MRTIKLLPAIVSIYILGLGGGLGLFWVIKDIESIPRAVQDAVPFLFRNTL